MATAWVESRMKRPKPKRRGKVDISEVRHGSRIMVGEEAADFLRQVGRRMIARPARSEHRLGRIDKLPQERRSVERAMLAVEDRMVRAFWVLSRLPNDRGIGFARRNGIDYSPDKEDRFANAVAAGGKWDQPPPKPGAPSSKDIDAMHEPLDWLRYLDREQARLLTAGAQSKKGDVLRNISWIRVRQMVPEMRGLTVVTLHRRYRAAIRTIVAELTIAKAQQMK